MIITINTLTLWVITVNDLMFMRLKLPLPFFNPSHTHSPLAEIIPLLNSLGILELYLLNKN